MGAERALIVALKAPLLRKAGVIPPKAGISRVLYDQITFFFLIRGKKFLSFLKRIVVFLNSIFLDEMLIQFR